VRSDPEGSIIIDARFFVVAGVGQLAVDGSFKVTGERNFKLTAMTEDGYVPWLMDELVQGEPGEWDPFPLFVPETLLGGRPLDEYVSKTFLDPRRPEAINDVRQFLVPAD